jgi:hypothetical protein
MRESLPKGRSSRAIGALLVMTKLASWVLSIAVEGPVQVDSETLSVQV